MATTPDTATPLPPSRRRARLRRVALWVVAAVALYGLLLGVALPPLARKLVADKLGETLGRTVLLERVTVNPYTLTAKAKNFRILEPDGRTAFVSFDLLDMDGSITSLYRLAPVVDALTLSGLKVSVVRDAETHFNFSDILARLAQEGHAARRKEGVLEEGGAHFSVSNIRVVGASFELDDRVKSARHQVTEVDASIPFVSNLPSHLREYVQPAFSAKVNGAALRLAGETLPFENSLRTHFTLALDAVDVRRYLEYVPAALPFRVEAGMLDANIAVRFTQAAGRQPSVDIAGTAALRDVALRTEEGPLARFARLETDVTSFDPLSGKATIKSVALRDAHSRDDQALVPLLEVHDIALDLKKRQARIASVATQDGVVSLKRNRDGSLELPKLVAAHADAAPDAAPAPWDIAVAKASVSSYKLTLVDAAVKPATTHRVSIDSLVGQDLTTRDGLAGTAAAHIGIGKSGTLELASTFALEPLAVSATLDARRIDLVPLRPYVKEFSTVALKGGTASAKGKATLRGKGDALHLGYRGTAEVADFATLDTVAREDLLNWKSVRTSGIDLDVPPGAPVKLAVAQIVADRMYARVVVLPDGKLNLQQLLAATPERPDAPAPAAEPARRNLRIDRITFVDGRLNFTDLFIRPNYTADVGELQGSVNGLSSAPDTRGTVDLKGRYDRSSPVVIAGTVNPLRGDLFLDIAAKGSDIELPKLTAYSQRYAGYGITAGKLTLDVKYHVDGGKMEGRNKIFVDQLTFGEKVEGPDATKLPVLFAVNLLKDSKGQINLELPVSGSLDDPQFQISGLVTQVLGALLRKAVTSPFSLLAAALGGGAGGGSTGDDLAFVDFEPGRSDLGEAARKKLDALVKALQDRPGIKLEIAAHADAKKDLEALRKAELQRQLAAAKRAELARAGKAPRPDEAVALDAAEYPRYLRVLYERDKPAKPAEAKTGQPAKDAAKEPPKEIPAAEMEAALLERITVGDDQLKALAAARGEQARGYLVAPGRLPAERVLLAASAPEAPDAKPSSRVDFALR